MQMFYSVHVYPEGGLASELKIKSGSRGQCHSEVPSHIFQWAPQLFVLRVRGLGGRVE